MFLGLEGGMSDGFCMWCGMEWLLWEPKWVVIFDGEMWGVLGFNSVGHELKGKTTERCIRWQASQWHYNHQCVQLILKLKEFQDRWCIINIDAPWHRLPTPFYRKRPLKLHIHNIIFNQTWCFVCASFVCYVPRQHLNRIVMIPELSGAKHIYFISQTTKLIMIWKLKATLWGNCFQSGEASIVDELSLKFHTKHT